MEEKIYLTNDNDVIKYKKMGQVIYSDEKGEYVIIKTEPIYIEGQPAVSGVGTITEVHEVTELPIVVDQPKKKKAKDKKIEFISLEHDSEISENPTFEE